MSERSGPWWEDPVRYNRWYRTNYAALVAARERCRGFDRDAHSKAKEETTQLLNALPF